MKRSGRGLYHMFRSIVLATMVLVGSGCTTSGVQEQSVTQVKETGDSKTVYLLVPNSNNARYVKFDQPNIISAFNKHSPDVQVKVLNAENSASKQLAQMETALADDADGIILITADSQQAGGMLAKAEQAGVPVVTYAQEAYGGPVAYHVSVPFVQIGEAHGEYLTNNLPESPSPFKLALIYGDPNFAFYRDLKKGFDKYLDPLIAEGKVKIVYEADTMGWAPANAQKVMEQCLTKTQNDVDGVLVMDDNNGSGVAAALAAQGLEGKIKMYGGYDARIDAVQRVLKGWQELDLTPPYQGMADAAVQLLMSTMNKTDPPANLVNGTFDNKFVKGGIPTAYIPNIFITADNVDDTVVKSGMYTKDELCTGLGVGTAYCK
ncbi:substrate-binding domain-containing protein [Brevibacillus sp. NRS-1366]|uniref:substrate-binding domain-containing protein n=1 Tax=Brevibacillus sp. NRS-1366 TaxID=3233899 RepID=UPI003D1D933F